MKILLACLLAAAAFACARTQAATPVNLQVCLTAPTSSSPGNVAGCPAGSFLFAPVAPDSLVRSQVNHAQGWRPFKTLQPADQAYAADGTWHALSTITAALAPTSGVPPPVVTPPACLPEPDRYIAMQWTCSVAGKVATCTAPIPP